MNRSFSLIATLVFGVVAFQTAAVEAGAPKSKASSLNAAKTFNQQTLPKTKPIVDPVKGQVNLNGVNGKGSIDPGYFGGTRKPSFPVTFGGNPPRGPSGSGFGVTFGGNPPRGPSQPNGDCHHECHDHDHYCHHDCYDHDHYCHHDSCNRWSKMLSNWCYGYDSDYGCDDYGM
jgi:hypothetical protein